MLTRRPSARAVGSVPREVMRELEASIHPVRTSKSDERPLPVAEFAPVRMHPIDAWVRSSRERMLATPPPVVTRRSVLSLIPWLLTAGAVIAVLLYVSQYGIRTKEAIVEQGNAAIGHLVSAKESAERLDLDEARDEIARAEDQFNGAARELEKFNGVISVLSHVPGFSSLRVGRDLLEVGRLLASVGASLGTVLDVVSEGGALLDSSASAPASLPDILNPLREALTKSQVDIERASTLLASIDEADTPEQYVEQFKELTERMPEIQGLVDSTISGVDFAAAFMGADRPQRYLVLFTNSSELRPTGGFPGSYGLLTFEGGRLKDFRADDVYNPDGQIKDLVVPPLQLQHITPGWGMRDAAWWADVPTSSKKVMEYWQLGGGAAVDGVISVKPELLVGILGITGPISMPAYDMVLDRTNVLATLQLEVESKKTAQPKQIIVDLAPLIMNRLATAPASQWFALFELFARAMDARDVTMYFDEPRMQSYVREQRWDGAVVETDGDYLMVNISNVKGAKSDAVTDTKIKVESRIEGGTMVHRLTISRLHNGGTSELGFYNKPNHSWVRVLVPKGSALRGIVGNEKPSYRPIIEYTDANSRQDPDLQQLESTYKQDASGVTTFEESGKTGFGFWMTVQPGSVEDVQLEYVVPARYISAEYSLYIQRQPGLSMSDVEVTIQKDSGTRVISSQPAMQEWPDSWRVHSKLVQDFEVRAQMQ